MLVGGTALLGSCGDGADVITYMDDDFPAGNCRDAATSGCDTTPTSTTDSESPTADVCVSSDECPSGVCSAPVAQTLGTFACVPGCIALMDESAWCADAAACCDPDAVCTARGYCALPSDGTSSSTGSSTGSEGTGSESTTGDASTGDSSTGTGTTGGTG